MSSGIDQDFLDADLEEEDCYCYTDENPYDEDLDDCYGNDLSGIDFTYADFSQEDLSGVDFTGSNLSKANLSGADLTEVCFRGTILTGAFFNEEEFSVTLV